MDVSGNFFPAGDLATRLKRIADILLDEMDTVLRDLGIGFESRWRPIYQLLTEKGPLTIAEIADSLQQSHPSILHITRPMGEAGLIEIHRDRLEGNRRVMKLTYKAESIREQLEEIWERMDEAQASAFRGGQTDIQPFLERLENHLINGNFARRILESVQLQAEASSA